MSHMKQTNTNSPHIIIPMGIPGSGKSFFAEHFADTFKSPIISYERLNKDFTDTELILKVSKCLLKELLKTRQTIIYDGRTDSVAERELIAKISIKNGYEPLFVWVQTEVSIAKKRSIKPTDGKTPITAEQFDSKLKAFNAPAQKEKTIVISGKQDYTSQLKIVLNHLADQPTITNNERTIRYNVTR